MPLKFTIATLGGTVEVPTLTSKVNLKIPPGTQSGQIFKLRGHGLTNLRSHRKGDQLIRVTIDVPKKLTLEQKAKLEEYAELCQDSTNPIGEGFVDKVKKFVKKL